MKTGQVETSGMIDLVIWTYLSAPHAECMVLHVSSVSNLIKF